MNFICKLSTVLELSLTCLYIDLSCQSVEHRWINTSTVLEWSLTCLQILSCYSLDHGRINISKYSVWVAPYLSIDSLMPLKRARENQLQRAASTTQWAGIWWISTSWSSSCLSMGSPPWVWSMTMSPISITVNSAVTITNHLLLSTLSYSQLTNDK